MSSRALQGDKPTSKRPRAAAISVAAGAAVGGVVFADRVVGVDDTIVLAGIGYLVYLTSYHVAKHVGDRRHPTAAAADKSDDVDMFSAFLDALHDQS